jgi:heme exporter protein D
MSNFFAMGGYAFFVWSAYALFGIVVLWNIVSARACYRTALADAKRRLTSQSS